MRKEKYKEAVDKFNDLIRDSKSLNSTEWIPKSLNNVLLIRCKENSPLVNEAVVNLMQSMEKISKKDAENNAKTALDNVWLWSNIDQIDNKQIALSTG